VRRHVRPGTNTETLLSVSAAAIDKSDRRFIRHGRVHKSDWSAAGAGHAPHAWVRRDGFRESARDK
jgi:hypothetical protein